MGIERRPDFEGFRVTREVPEPDEVPMFPAFLCNVELVPADVEGRPLPAVLGLDLDQPIRTIGTEAVDVVAGPIAVFLSNPSDHLGEVVLARLVQDQPLVLEHRLLAGLSKCPVPGIPACDVELAGDRQHLLKFGWRRRVAQGRRGTDPQRLRVAHVPQRRADRRRHEPTMSGWR